MSGRTLGGELELELPLACAPAAPPAGFVTVESGRSALRLVARLLPRDRPVLLPDYLCDSVVEPFRAEGIAVAYYAVGEDLAVDAELVRRRADETGAGAVLAINYFGCRIGTSVLAAATLPENVWRIEDWSHGSLLERGDVAPPSPHVFRVTSLRKYLALPDGALCDGDGLDQPAAGEGRAARLRLLAQGLRHEFLEHGGDGLEQAYLSLFEHAERELAGAKPEAMSAASTALLARIDLREAAERRRANYATLLDAFERDDALRSTAVPLLGELPADVSPLAFPVRVAGDRDALRAELRRRRAFCPVHWSLPERGREAGAAARRLSSSILSLPVDQRYGERDMAELLERMLASAAAVSA